MSSYIGPIADSLIDGIIKEFQKKEVKEKIEQNIINPLLADVLRKYYPYLVTIVIIFIIIILLLIWILILEMKHRCNHT